MSTLSQALALLRHELKNYLGRKPDWYYRLYRFRTAYRDRLVDEDTEICIEGFPRSANSFAVGAFTMAQERSVRVAHHNHVPAPLLRAAEREVPAVVLVRDPVDAVVSGRGLELQIGAVEGTVPPHVPYRSRIQAWISFYESILPVRSRMVVAPFNVVIRDFGRIIDAVNDRFGTSFERFDHNPDAVEAVRRTRGYHALPSDQRNALKNQARETFSMELGENHPLVVRARGLNRRLAEYAQRVYGLDRDSGSGSRSVRRSRVA